MNNTVSFSASKSPYTINSNTRPRRTPESVNIVGPTKNYNDRIDVRFDNTTVSFPKKTTLEDLLKGIDKMMNTYLGGSKSVKPVGAQLKMYG